MHTLTQKIKTGHTLFANIPGLHNYLMYKNAYEHREENKIKEISEGTSRKASEDAPQGKRKSESVGALGKLSLTLHSIPQTQANTELVQEV